MIYVEWAFNDWVCYSLAEESSQSQSGNRRKFGKLSGMVARENEGSRSGNHPFRSSIILQFSIAFRNVGDQ